MIVELEYGRGRTSGAHARRMRGHGAAQESAAGDRRHGRRRGAGVRRAQPARRRSRTSRAAGAPRASSSATSPARSRTTLFLGPMIRILVRERNSRAEHHRPGRDRTPPAQRGRGARGAHRRSVGARHGPGRESLRARRRRPRRPRGHRDPGHTGEARPAVRRCRAPDRDRARRAALHGGLVRGPQGRRPRGGARGHHPHLPQRAVHGGPGRHPVQPRRQSAARGAARDHAHARRGPRRQHRHRRAAAALLRELRRHRRSHLEAVRFVHATPAWCRWGGSSRPSSPPPPAIRSTGPTTRP